MSILNPAGASAPDRDQILFWAALVLAAVFALGIALYVVLVLMPDLRLRSSLQEELAVARVDLAAAQRTQATAPDRARSQLESARTRLAGAATAFLGESQITTFLNRIYTYSRAAGVEVVSLQAQPAQVTNVYTRKSFDFRLAGSLDGLLGFLARIQEVSLPGFVIDNVQLVPAAEDTGHTLALSVIIYTSPYAQAQAVAPAPGELPAEPASLSELYAQLDEAWASNNWERAISLLSQIRAITPDDERASELLYRAHVNRGYHLLAAGNIDGAAAQFNAALGVKPDGQEAIVELRQLATDPSLAQSVTRGLEAELQAAWNRGDWPEAIRLLRQIQLLKPDRADIAQRLYEAYLGYGDQLAAEGKNEAAQEIYRRADRLRPADSSPGVPVTTTLTPGSAGGPAQVDPPTLTPTPSPTSTPTPSPSPSPSPTASPSPSPSPTPSATPTPSNTPTATFSPSPSPTSSHTPTPTGSATATPTATGSMTGSPTPTPTGGYSVHIVQPGETLFSISQRYGITVEALMAANNLRNTTIYVGQALIIPPVSVITPVPTLRIYVVQRGDTLYSIARRFGTTVDAIRRANGLPTSNIVVGQQLRIPPA